VEEMREQKTNISDKCGWNAPVRLFATATHMTRAAPKIEKTVPRQE
jgi:hypothetical protein